MPFLPAPAGQMNGEVRGSTADPEATSDGKPGERAFDQDMGAPVETEVVNIDNRRW